MVSEYHHRFFWLLLCILLGSCLVPGLESGKYPSLALCRTGNRGLHPRFPVNLDLKLRGGGEPNAAVNHDGCVAREELDRVLGCTMCLSFLLLPKTLPCGHSFCSSCIESWLRTGGHPAPLEIKKRHQRLSMSSRLQETLLCSANSKRAAFFLSWKIIDTKKTVFVLDDFTSMFICVYRRKPHMSFVSGSDQCWGQQASGEFRLVDSLQHRVWRRVCKKVKKKEKWPGIGEAHA